MDDCQKLFATHRKEIEEAYRAAAQDGVFDPVVVAMSLDRNHPDQVTILARSKIEVIASTAGQTPGAVKRLHELPCSDGEFAVIVCNDRRGRLFQSKIPA